MDNKTAKALGHKSLATDRAYKPEGKRPRKRAEKAKAAKTARNAAKAEARALEEDAMREMGDDRYLYQ